MSDIFICYSRTDITIATRLEQRLLAEGWSVFLDVQVNIGLRGHQEIEKELHAAKAVVALWSASSRDSDFVLEEAEYGKRKGILFPALIERVEYPYGFGRIQTGNLVGWENNQGHSGLAQLLDSLRTHLNGQAVHPGPKQPIPPPGQTFLNKLKGVREGPLMRKLLPATLIMMGLGIAVFIPEWSGSKKPVSVPEVPEEMTPDTMPAKQSDFSEPAPLPKLVTMPAKQSDFSKPAPLPKLVLIPAGSFNMGEKNVTFIKNLNPDSKKYYGIPGKTIEIRKPFYLGKTEITYEQYDYYIQERQRSGQVDEYVVSPPTAAGGRGNHPVVNISWHEATAYAAWLGKRQNKNHQSCRLPTEAEWEYAARAGTETAYPWGDDIGKNNANCDGCGSQWDNKQSAPVGSFEPRYGLFDMSGNVMEWTCSSWRGQFDGSEQQCVGRDDSEARVLRGGSWNLDPVDVRAAARYFFTPDNRINNIGFRVLCSSPIE